MSDTKNRGWADPKGTWHLLVGTTNKTACGLTDDGTAGRKIRSGCATCFPSVAEPAAPIVHKAAAAPAPTPPHVLTVARAAIVPEAAPTAPVLVPVVPPKTAPPAKPQNVYHGPPHLPLRK